ncbi:MAG: PrgI family protein [Ignavibacteriales bacterium]
MVVNINAQISNYKERVAGNYTLRQVICLAAAAFAGVSTYFYLNVQKDIKQFIVILVVLPIAVAGFYTYQGMSFERFIYYVVREFFIPQKRPFVPSDIEMINRDEGDDIDDKKIIKLLEKKKVKKVPGK